MKKAFDGGWDECMKLKELKVSPREHLYRRTWAER